MSWAEFDLARHPVSDVHDDLSEHLYRMAPDEHVGMPDGSEVHKVDKNEYHLFNRHGRKIGQYDDHETAAHHTLDQSVRSHHLGSLGGSKAYPSFEHYKKEH